MQAQLELSIHQQNGGGEMRRVSTFNKTTSAEQQRRSKNVDHMGYPVLEQYLWDIGEDEEIEKLIDKAIRMILIHPIFVQRIWRNADAIQNLYRDNTFQSQAEFVKKHMFRISKNLLIEEAKKKKVNLNVFSGIGDAIDKTFRATSVSSTDTNNDDKNNNDKKKKEKKRQSGSKGGPPGLHKQKSAEELYAEEYRSQNEKYNFWSFAEYKDLKEKFGIPMEDSTPAHDREIYLWSFLLAIACTIKYLEIEISSTAQYDLKQNETDLENDGTGLQWQGFVMAPTNASAAINVVQMDDEEEKVVGKKRTFSMGFGAQFVPLDLKRIPTTFGDASVKQCLQCHKYMMETAWTAMGQFFCEECVKFRVYMECVRKFVLEYENDEIRDDLWPWYENNKYHKQNDDYRKTLENYAEQVLQIDPMDLGTKPTLITKNSSILMENTEDDDSAMMQNGENNIDANSRSIRKKFQHSSYQNIRYLRKFAAMFMLSEREIWKDLVKLKKDLKSMRAATVQRKQEKEKKQQMLQRDRKASELELIENRRTGRDRAMSSAQILKQNVVLDDDPDLDDSDDDEENKYDKSNVDHDENYTLTREDRQHLKEVLMSEEDEIVANILYSTYPGIRLIDKVKQGKVGKLSTEETVYLTKYNVPLTNFDHNSSKSNFEYGKSKSNLGLYHNDVDDEKNDNMGDLPDDMAGIDSKQTSYQIPGESEGHQRFLESWIRLPLWWDINHDVLLLELALMHKLDVHKYGIELEHNPYFEDQLERVANGRAFEVWCTQPVNVMHRLRFLTYIVDNKKMPESTVFLNEVMRFSHLNSFWAHTEIEKRGDDPLAASTFVRQQIEENDENEATGIYDSDERPVRDIEREFRDIVQLLDPGILGEKIWEYCMEHLIQKQRQSLWRALTILAEELPTNVVLPLLEKYRDSIRRGKPEYVNAVCRAVIKGSIYPMATALHLARYMDENATRDLARYDIWKSLAKTYEDIAVQLVNEVENDFLLGLLLEIPTAIGQLSSLEIAVTYQRKSFLNDARVIALVSHMWSESEFLNPQKKIRSGYLGFDKLLILLWQSPVRFYFSPMGLYTTTAALYMVYVLMMSYITFKRYYPYTHVNSSEYIFWIMNLGYILYEFAEMIHKGTKYFGLESILNVFDVLISANWIVLATLRFAPDFVIENTSLDKKWAYDEDGNREIDTNSSILLVYMALWGVQIIIIWVRVIGLFQRTERIGPFLRMLVLIGGDIFGFMILLFVVFCGFVYALYFIIAGDFDYDFQCASYDTEEYDPDCEEVSQALNSINGCMIYLFQTFMGQQDWTVIKENEYYDFGRGRATLAQMLIFIFIFVGTLLLLNLLIAVMATTFNQHREAAKKELSFSRVETTYDLAHRGRLMPPPLNLVAFAVWFLLEFLFFFVLFITCGQVELNIEFLNPYYIKAFARQKEQALIDIEDIPENNRQMTVARPRESISMKRDKSPRPPSDDDGIGADFPDTGAGGGAGGGAGDLTTKTKSESNDNLMKQRVGNSSVSQDQRNDNVQSNDEMESDDNKDNNKDNKNEKRVRIPESKAEREHVAPPSKQSVIPPTSPTLNSARSTMPAQIFNDIGETLGNLFDTIESQGSATAKKYCKHCYTKMNTHKGGNIEDYYLRFDNNGYGLDFEDRSHIKRLFRYCSLCPQCFRPFALSEPKEDRAEPDVDRYTRHTVLQEIASCYVFLIFVWMPLLFLFAIPALLSYFFKRVSKLNDTSHTTRTSASASFGDYHRGSYHENIKQVIDGVKNPHDFDEENFGEKAEENDKLMKKMVDDLSSKVDTIQFGVTQLQTGNTGNGNTSAVARQSRMNLHNDIRKLNKAKSKRKLDSQKNKKENNDKSDNYRYESAIDHKDSIMEDAETDDPQASSHFMSSGLQSLQKIKSQNSKGDVLKDTGRQYAGYDKQ